MKWIILAAAVLFVAAVAKLMRVKAQRRNIKVGAVSEEWVAQHRSDPYQP